MGVVEYIDKFTSENNSISSEGGFILTTAAHQMKGFCNRLIRLSDSIIFAPRFPTQHI